MTLALRPAQLPVLGAEPAVNVIELDEGLRSLLWANSREHVLLRVKHVQSDLPVVSSLVEPNGRQDTLVGALATERCPLVLLCKRHSALLVIGVPLKLFDSLQEEFGARGDVLLGRCLVQSNRPQLAHGVNQLDCAVLHHLFWL